MIMKSEEEKIYLSSFEIRKRLNLPMSISSLLNVYEVSINDHNSQYNSFFAVTNHELFDITIELQKAFLKFNRSEKIYHYTFCVQFLKAVLDNNLLEQGQTYKKYLFERKSMEVRAYQRPGMLSLWEKILVVFNFEERTMTLVTGKEEKYSLKQYYMRESKDPSKFSLIFESITPLAPKASVRVGFDSKSFNEIKIKLRRLMEEIEKQRLFEELSKNSSKGPKRANSVKNELTYLNQQIVNNFKVFLQQVRERPEITLPKTQLYRSSSKVISILQEVYFLEEIFLIKKETIMQILRLPHTKWNTMCKESVVIEKIQNGKLQAFFYKFEFQEKTFQCTIAREEKNAQDQGLILIQTLEPTMSKEMFRFDYMILRVTKVTEEISRMTVETRISTGGDDTKEFVVEYLMEFSNIATALGHRLERQKSINSHKPPNSNIQVNLNYPQSAQQTVYIDAIGKEENYNDSSDQQDQMAMSQDSEVYQKTESKSDSTHVESTKASPTPQENLQEVLFFKHVTYPMPKDQPKRVEVHYIDTEWRRNKHGVLICTNQRILDEQKKVAKHVFTTFGRNILRHKSFLSISLPVSICIKKSHLQMIALNFCFAPLVLEPYCNADPLERMKKLMIFNVTVGNTGVGSEKPFNPILGETYQGLINGCPISLEQISHHPAISTYFFEGRGYRIVGSIQPKIEICGINSGRGSSERQNRVEFDDGSIVYMSYAKMLTRGFLFGEREFMLESKNFIFDSKNLLFTELYYGPRKTSFFGGTDDPYDLVYGKIFRVKPSFIEVFREQKNKGFPQKEHIAAQLSSFEGTWTQYIKTDGVEAFNFRAQLPIILEPYPAPLPSNSSFRSDINKYIQNKISEAQEEKERLEDVQRRDKNLRDKARDRILKDKDKEKEKEKKGKTK